MRRANVVLLSALVVLPISADRAVASMTEPELAKSAWFWESGTRTRVPGTGVQVQTPNPAASGHRLVGTVPGRADKRTFLAWDVSALAGATVTRFVVTLPVSSAGDVGHLVAHASAGQPPPQTMADQVATMQVCPLKADAFIPDGAEAAPTTVTVVTESGETAQVNQEPDFDCDLAKAELKRSADGTSWTGDLAPIARLWAPGTHPATGVAVMPAEATAAWTVEFHPDGITAAAEFTPGQPSFTAATAPPFPPPSSTEVLASRGGEDVSVGTPTTETIPATPGQTVVRRRGAGDPIGRAVAGAGRLPWYVWLLVPGGFGGLWMTARSLRPEWAAAFAWPGFRIASLLRKEEPA